MAEQNVTFKSKGFILSGAVKVPTGVGRGEKRPAFIVLHGFGSTAPRRQRGQGPCAMLDKLGYVTMRFDMPGCGESEGGAGGWICLDQVQATRRADAAGTAPECRWRPIGAPARASAPRSRSIAAASTSAWLP